MKEFGILARYIKEARLSAKLTQDQLAEELGMTKGNVSGWENDKHHPSPQQLATVARITGKPLPKELSPIVGERTIEGIPVTTEQKKLLDGFAAADSTARETMLWLAERALKGRHPSPLAAILAPDPNTLATTDQIIHDAAPRRTF